MVCFNLFVQYHRPKAPALPEPPYPLNYTDEYRRRASLSRSSPIDEPVELLGEGSQLWSMQILVLLSSHATLSQRFSEVCSATACQCLTLFELLVGSGSGAVFFMIVSFPAEAADTICCSIDLVTLAFNALRMLATWTKAGFLGGSCRFPFFGAAAALAACLAFDDEALAWRPFVLP